LLFNVFISYSKNTLVKIAKYLLDRSRIIYLDYIRPRVFGGLTIKNGNMGSLTFVGADIGANNHWHSCPDMNFTATIDKGKSKAVHTIKMNYCITMALAHIYKLIP